MIDLLLSLLYFIITNDYMLLLLYVLIILCSYYYYYMLLLYSMPVTVESPFLRSSLQLLHATIPSTHIFMFCPIWSNSGLCFSESGQKDSERRKGEREREILYLKPLQPVMV